MQFIFYALNGALHCHWLIIDVLAENILQRKIKFGSLKFVKDRTKEPEENEDEQCTTPAEVSLP